MTFLQSATVELKSGDNICIVQYFSYICEKKI